LKTALRIILIVAIALMIYGYWGAFTPSGNKVYDEMDGYFPFFLLIGGVILFIVFLILVFIRRRKAKK
jgi:heme/copper-type cytochrome/quinol oxidase subunit 2